MPYGIKGKTKNWEESAKAGREADNRIESCVAGLMADKSFKPRDGEDKKTTAIRVCKSSITRLKEFKNKLG
jgi:hypothetical protein